MTNTNIIEKVLKDINDEYPSFLAHDEICNVEVTKKEFEAKKKEVGE
jgi:hypothetical protein